MQSITQTPTAVAVAREQIYVTAPAERAIVVFDKASEAVTVLADKEGASYGVAVDEGRVYWTSDAGRIRSISRADGDRVTLAEGQQDPTALAIDENRVYWVNAGDGRVMAVPKAGGEAIVVASGQDTPTSVAVDETSIYWATEGGGEVLKAPK
jgi:sugar lactone lactonase YvrE